MRNFRILSMVFALLIGTVYSSMRAQVTPDCASYVVSGALYQGVPANLVSVTLPYTNGQGQPYSGATYFSYDVAGLAAQLQPGLLNEDAGSLFFTINGTPTATGMAQFDVIIGNSLCNIQINVDPQPNQAFVANLVCDSVDFSGDLIVGSMVNNVSFTLPYTGGNGGFYGQYSVYSFGVSGLTASVNQGFVANGSGTIQFTIAGVPANPGTAYFNLVFGTKNCLISVAVTPPPAAISEIVCDGVIDNGVLVVGAAAAGVSTLLPYLSGNQGTYSAQSIVSSGVTGLTATLSAGLLANGPGNLLLNISGTPSSAGVASFNFDFLGQSCLIQRNITSPNGVFVELNCSAADTVITSWDFANGIPSNWSQNVVSSNGIAQWEYRGTNTSPSLFVGARGNCAGLAQPINSNTQANGFVIFDANYWDAVTGNCGVFSSGIDPVPSGGYIAELITNQVNINSENDLFLSFNQQYRLLGLTPEYNYQSSVNVLVSIDGNNWNTVYTISGNSQSANVINTVVNISSFISGASALQVKFQFLGSNFWWLLDDVCLYRPSVNDIAINATSFLPSIPSSVSPNHVSEYKQYPVGMPPILRYSAQAINNGINIQNNVKLRGKVLRDNVQISNTISSQSLNLGSLQNASIVFNNNYSPPANPPASFSVIYSLEQTEVDENLANNSDTTNFLITPNVLSKDNGSAEAFFIESSENEAKVRRDGNYFLISSSGNFCHGIRVGFDETTSPNTTVLAKIAPLVYNSTEQSFYVGGVIATSQPTQVNAAHINFEGDENLATISFASPVALSNNTVYFVSVEETNGEANFGVARSGESVKLTSTSSYENYLQEFIPYDTLINEIDTTLIVTEFVISGDSVIEIQTEIDTVIVVEIILYDTVQTLQLDERISSKTFMIRMLMSQNTSLMGCTDPVANNYNPQAITDNLSCFYTPGCASPLANNFNPLADYDDGSCVIPGCTDPEALNYLPYATISAPCTYPIQGCTEPLAINFDPEAMVDNGSCIIIGCTDSLAVNFLDIANSDDFSCLYRGCLDSLACNYISSADINGNCEYPGCNNPSACNFDPLAFCDDGSCCFAYCNTIDVILSEEGNMVDWSLLLNGNVLASGVGNSSVPTCNVSACDYEVVINNVAGLIDSLVITISDPNAILYSDIFNNISNDSVIFFGLGEIYLGCTDVMAVNYDSNSTCDDGSCVVYGCTNEGAYNFLINASIDDGTCLYVGCTDVLASNYVDSASIDDGGCLYPGCTDTLALNFDNEFNINDGSCLYPDSGCTNALAQNYSEYALIDDGSCIFYGCTNSLAVNYDSSANSDDGSCIITGCIDTIAINYDPSANVDNGSCDYQLGCTDSTAINYDMNAVNDDGSCIVIGCTNAAAINYNPLANIDNGSCQFVTMGCTDTLAENYNPLAVIDDGTCEFSGCSDSNACNFNPLASGTSGFCIIVGDPCNDGSASTSNDIINTDCICVGSLSSMFGCSDITALNFNPNALIDDGSCLLSAPQIISQFSSGCAPLTTTLIINANLNSEFDCIWMINDVIVDSTCNDLLVSDLDIGAYSVELAVGYLNPWTNTYSADTSATFVEVTEGAVLPIINFDNGTQLLSCSNCENQIQWFYEGQYISGASSVSVISNSVYRNGRYDLVHTGANGCISDTTSVMVTEAFLLSGVTEGCAPFSVQLSSPIVLANGMSCSLELDGVVILENFMGNTELLFDEQGLYEIAQVCVYDGYSSSSVIPITVNEAYLPELAHLIDSSLVQCLNASLFDSIAWTVDGTFEVNVNSIPDTGTFYACVGYGPGNCESQSIINIDVLGIESDINSEDYFSVYPNPSNGWLSIGATDVVVSSVITDMWGRSVAMFGNERWLDISFLQNGFYTIRVQSINGMRSVAFEIIK